MKPEPRKECRYCGLVLKRVRCENNLPGPHHWRKPGIPVLFCSYCDRLEGRGLRL